ncbi:MAG: ABC transporter permease subunit [Deltaproteobacteria bacterium]|nr:ABC transporter permease subunit [Deltaproteobacteria bacterium]
MNRVWALSVITYKEGIRNRSLFGILAFALFVLGLNISVAGFFMREVGKVTVDMNLSALTFSGLLLVFFVALHLMAKDIDKKTIQLVFSKPLSRGEYILGKYLGILFFVVVSLLALAVFSIATVSLVRGLYPNYFAGFSWPIFFTAGCFVLVQLAVLCAILILFSTVTTSSFASLIFTVCVYLVGVTIEDVLFYIQSGFRTEAISPVVQEVVKVVSYILPNFSMWDFKLEAAHGLAIGAERIGLGLGYAAVYIVVLLALATLFFQRREFN